MSAELIVKKGKKELNSIVFYPSMAYNFGTTGPIQVGFSAKCTSPNDDFNQIKKKPENVTCPTSD